MTPVALCVRTCLAACARTGSPQTAPGHRGTSSSASTKSVLSWLAGCRRKVSWAISISAASTAWQAFCEPEQLTGHCKDVAEYVRSQGVNVGVYRAAAVQRAAHERAGECPAGHHRVGVLRSRCLRIRPHPGPSGRDQRHAGAVGLRYAVSRHGRRAQARNRSGVRQRWLVARQPRHAGDRRRGQVHLQGSDPVPPAPLWPERRGDPGLQVPLA